MAPSTACVVCTRRHVRWWRGSILGVVCYCWFWQSTPTESHTTTTNRPPSREKAANKRNGRHHRPISMFQDWSNCRPQVKNTVEQTRGKRGIQPPWMDIPHRLTRFVFARTGIAVPHSHMQPRQPSGGLRDTRYWPVRELSNSCSPLPARPEVTAGFATGQPLYYVKLEQKQIEWVDAVDGEGCQT